MNQKPTKLYYEKVDHLFLETPLTLSKAALRPDRNLKEERLEACRLTLQLEKEYQRMEKEERARLGLPEPPDTSNRDFWGNEVKEEEDDEDDEDEEDEEDQEEEEKEKRRKRKKQYYRFRQGCQPEQYYCPYRGCDATPRFSNGIMLHIRRNHYAGCPGIEISNKRVYKTPSGDDLHLDSESCRNMLEPGDEISVIFLDEIGIPNEIMHKRNLQSFNLPSLGTWYCPYEGCNFAYVKSTRLRLHVNKEHNAEMELPGTGSTEMKYSTPSGEPIDFSSVSCRRMLKHGEKISVQFTPRKHIETLYCPYKGCTKKSANTILLHRHIRRKHCPELISDLRMLMNSHYICFTTPSGKPLHYDESCRDTVDEGEPIILKSISFKQKYTILCPYEGCTTFKKLRTLMYQHIRVQHDAFFPKLPRGPFIHSFTSPSGEEIKFDDHSRNSLKEGESISVTTTAVKKKYPTLDVDQLK